MSVDVAPSYSITANLRWFAIVYVVVTVILAAAVEIAYRNGVEIPTTGLNIGAFAGIAGVAGQRFATKRGWSWTSADRNRLALGYVAVSFVASFALLGVLMGFDAITRSAIVGMITQLGAIFVVILGMVTLVFFGMARFMLALIAKRGKK